MEKKTESDMHLAMLLSVCSDAQAIYIPLLNFTVNWVTVSTEHVAPKEQERTGQCLTSKKPNS